MKNQKHPSELFSSLIFLWLLLVVLCFLEVLLTSGNQCLGLLHLDFTTLEITNESMLGNWSWWNLMGKINKYHWNLEFTNKTLKKRKNHNWYQKGMIDWSPEAIDQDGFSHFQAIRPLGEVNHYHPQYRSWIKRSSGKFREDMNEAQKCWILKLDINGCLGTPASCEKTTFSPGPCGVSNDL